MKYKNIKMISVVLASAVTITACNPQDEGSSQNIRVSVANNKSGVEGGLTASPLGKAMKDSQSFREAKLKDANLQLTKLDLDLSQSTLFITGEKYKYAIYDGNNSDNNPWIIPETGKDVLSCNSRASCILTLEGRVMETLNETAKKNNEEYNFYLVLLNSENKLVGAANVILDGFSGASLVGANSNLFANADLVYEMMQAEYFKLNPGKSALDFSVFLNSVFTDTVLANFKRSAGENEGYVNKTTIIYFYMMYMLNKQSPASVTEFTSAINLQVKNLIKNKTLDSGFVSDPKSSMNNLLDILSKMRKANYDADFARTANDIADFAKNVNPIFDTLKGLPIPKFKGVFGTGKDIMNGFNDAINFLSTVSGSQAALQEYENMRNQVTGFIIPPYTLLDAIELLRKNILNMNSYIMSSKQVSMGSDFQIQMQQILYPLGGLSIEKYISENSYYTSPYDWVKAINFDVLKRDIDIMTDASLIKSVASQMRDSIGLSEPDKMGVNRIALARAYNYELQRLMFMQIAMVNKYSYMEKIIAYGAFAKHQSYYDVRQVFVKKGIPDVNSSQISYDDAIKEIDSKTRDRNNKLVKLYSEQSVNEGDYIPAAAIHLVTENSCDFTFSDGVSKLSGYCKYFAPKDSVPSGVIINPSNILANQCDKDQGNFKLVKKVENYLGALSCFDPGQAGSYGAPTDGHGFMWNVLDSETRDTYGWHFWKEDEYFTTALDYYNVPQGGGPADRIKAHARVYVLGEWDSRRFSIRGQKDDKDKTYTQFDSYLKLSEVPTNTTEYHDGDTSQYAGASMFEIKDKLDNKIGLFVANVTQKDVKDLNGRIRYRNILAGVIPAMGGCKYSDGQKLTICPVKIGKDSTANYELNFNPLIRINEDDKGKYLLDFVLGYKDIPFTDVKSIINEYLKSGAFNACSGRENSKYSATTISQITAKCRTKGGDYRNLFDKGNNPRSSVIKSCDNDDGFIRCKN